MTKVIATHRVSAGLNLRQSPVGGKVIFTLTPGTLVWEVQRDGDWSRVSVNGMNGWVANRFLTPLQLTVPCATDLKPFTFAQRQTLLGNIQFVHAPVKGNPEHIRITNSWATDNIVRLDVPQLVGVRGANTLGTVWIHKRVSKQFADLFAAWEKADLLKHILTWDGCYVPRLIRGSKTSLSLHAHGSAFDINAAWNGLNKEPAAFGNTGSVVALVPLAERHGFYWGGNFSRKDGMHFEVAKLL
jgi:hypothetical protein